ncbi:hypothetical protein [uncultured Helicobacter sp.]|uniref:type II toxin-antitoxin system RelE family toxin n=1 Tax=uncultured Helicobacter sp. TaxID=175537 RepID=UPI00260B323A|nr:hypothetical protein [uncultured Helicobacter sp.]
MYVIKYLKEVSEDFKLLPKEVLAEVKTYIQQYKIEPFSISQPLENKFGLNLKNCRKTYIANSTYRIVIKIENHIAKIVLIVAVDKRDKLKAYKEAHKRLTNT